MFALPIFPRGRVIATSGAYTGRPARQCDHRSPLRVAAVFDRLKIHVKRKCIKKNLTTEVVRHIICWHYLFSQAVTRQVLVVVHELNFCVRDGLSPLRRRGRMQQVGLVCAVGKTQACFARRSGCRAPQTASVPVRCRWQIKHGY